MMALFTAYESFHPYPALVDHTLRPIIEADVAEFFYQTLHLDNARNIVDRFTHSLHDRFREAQNARALTVVEDISVGYNASEHKVVISWKMRGWVIHTMVIAFARRSQSERDDNYAKKLARMAAVAEFAASLKEVT
jgi:hypothetical protein